MHVNAGLGTARVKSSPRALHGAPNLWRRLHALVDQQGAEPLADCTLHAAGRTTPCTSRGSEGWLHDALINKAATSPASPEVAQRERGRGLLLHRARHPHPR